jgi:hypothetical protein
VERNGTRSIRCSAPDRSYVPPPPKRRSGKSRRTNNDNDDDEDDEAEGPSRDLAPGPGAELDIVWTTSSDPSDYPFSRPTNMHIEHEERDSTIGCIPIDDLFREQIEAAKEAGRKEARDMLMRLMRQNLSDADFDKVMRAVNIEEGGLDPADKQLKGRAASQDPAADPTPLPSLDEDVQMTERRPPASEDENMVDSDKDMLLDAPNDEGRTEPTPASRERTVSVATKASGTNRVRVVTPRVDEDDRSTVESTTSNRGTSGKKKAAAVDPEAVSEAQVSSLTSKSWALTANKMPQSDAEEYAAQLSDRKDTGGLSPAPSDMSVSDEGNGKRCKFIHFCVFICALCICTGSLSIPQAPDYALMHGRAGSNNRAHS